MANKRFVSKDTTESTTREAIESTPVKFLVYSNTQLFMEKESDLTWKNFNKDPQRRPRGPTCIH